jgi:hypothetical protein
MALTIVGISRPVTGGVDTHLDLNVAAAFVKRPPKHLGSPAHADMRS